jgi:hypothetical protein
VIGCEVSPGDAAVTLSEESAGAAASPLHEESFVPESFIAPSLGRFRSVLESVVESPPPSSGPFVVEEQAIMLETPARDATAKAAMTRRTSINAVPPWFA